jgi:small GTP-binding protein
MILAKVCLLGEVSVGKTSLIRRFVDRSFSESYLSSVGVSISRNLIHVPASPEHYEGEVQLILWDLQGGNDYGATAVAYLRGARAAVVVGDLTRNVTLEALGEHIERFLNVNPEASVIVALNKADLRRDPTPMLEIDPAHRRAILKTLSTSAKTAEGVDDLFGTLAAHFQRRVEHGSAL